MSRAEQVRKKAGAGKVQERSLEGAGQEYGRRGAEARAGKDDFSLI